LQALQLVLTKPLTLKELAGTIKSLKKLQSLTLSGLGLTGVIDAPAGDGLAALTNLQNLDLSNNAELGGQLPDWLAGLTALQTLNISHTGIGGSLPTSYVSLQQLLEFRAVSCSNISGKLPLEYALLQRLQVLEVSNSGLSGPLPVEWGDSPNMRATHSAMLASSQALLAQVQRSAAQAQVKYTVAMNGRLQPDVLNRFGRGSGAFHTTSDMSRTARFPEGFDNGATLEQYSAAQLEADAAKRALVSLRSINFKATTTIGMLSLQELRLPDNMLTGSFPDSFANMKQLRIVDVSQSAQQHAGGIEGRLPAKWASLQQLKVSVVPRINGASVLRCTRLYHIK
jgi:hypothetical protein